MPAERRVTLGDVGLDATAIDRSADPCQDFDQYSCGGWLATHDIPFGDRTSRGVGLEAERVAGADAAPIRG